MDSKPIAIILGIVITVGAMGSVGLYASNILTGTATSTDIIPKTLELVQTDSGTLEANIQFTNQGTDTLTYITGAMEIGDAVNPLEVRSKIVEPYERVWLSGTVLATASYAKDTAYQNIPSDTVDIRTHCDVTEADLKKSSFTFDDVTFPTVVACVDIAPASEWKIYPGQEVLVRLNMNTASGDQIEKLVPVIVR